MQPPHTTVAATPVLKRLGTYLARLDRWGYERHLQAHPYLVEGNLPPFQMERRLLLPGAGTELMLFPAVGLLVFVLCISMLLTQDIHMDARDPSLLLGGLLIMTVLPLLIAVPGFFVTREWYFDTRRRVLIAQVGNGFQWFSDRVQWSEPGYPVDELSLHIAGPDRDEQYWVVAEARHGEQIDLSSWGSGRFSSQVEAQRVLEQMQSLFGSYTR